jgi:hypothetical protein
MECATAFGNHGFHGSCNDPCNPWLSLLTTPPPQRREEMDS